MSCSVLGTQTHESIDSSCQKRYKKGLKEGYQNRRVLVDI